MVGPQPTARVLLAPSQWQETGVRVATEARINGIPVLGSDHGGMPQVIGPGGLVVSVDAPIESWLAAQSQVWDDAASHTAFAGRRAYARRPDIQPETMIARTDKIFGSRLYASERRMPRV